MTDSFIPVGDTGKNLNTNLVTTDAGEVHNEVVEVQNDFTMSVAKGDITGMSKFEKFGRNPQIDTTSGPEDIWHGGGLYTGFPDTADTIDVYGGVNDTAAGTGLRTVRLYGLDTDYNEITEDITLNGTTPVTTTQTFIRMARMRGLTAGSGGVNADIITAEQTNDAAAVMAKMPAGSNRTQIVAWTVPAGKTLYIRDFTFSTVRSSGSAGSGTSCILQREFGAVWEQMYTTSISTGSPSNVDTAYFFTVTEKTDMVARILDVSDNATEVSARAIGVYVDNV